jgi:Tol biopolymer transport system component
MKNRLHLFSWILLVFPFVVSCGGGDDDSSSSEIGKIAFTSYKEDGNHEIYVMDADGDHQENISNHSSWDNEPSWSPDGTQIAFVSGRAGHAQIYVMDENGNNQQNISNNSSDDDSPTWKP